MSETLGLFGGMALLFAYFLPSLTAHARRHYNLGLIVAFNLLLGWTGVAWLAALVWACNSNCPDGR